MKSLSKILLAAILLAGNGHIYAKPALTVKSAGMDVQDRHLSGFHAVEVSGSYDVYLTQGGSESVKVEAPSDMMDHIVTEVEDGILKIYNKHESGWNSALAVSIVLPMLANGRNTASHIGSGTIINRDATLMMDIPNKSTANRRR